MHKEVTELLKAKKIEDLKIIGIKEIKDEMVGNVYKVVATASYDTPIKFLAPGSEDLRKRKSYGEFIGKNVVYLLKIQEKKDKFTLLEILMLKSEKKLKSLKDKTPVFGLPIPNVGTHGKICVSSGSRPMLYRSHKKFNQAIIKSINAAWNIPLLLDNYPGSHGIVDSYQSGKNNFPKDLKENIKKSSYITIEYQKYLNKKIRNKEPLIQVDKFLNSCKALGEESPIGKWLEKI